MRKVVALEQRLDSEVLLREKTSLLEATHILKTLGALGGRKILGQLAIGASLRYTELPGNQKFHEYAFNFLEALGYVTLTYGDLVSATPLGKGIFQSAKEFDGPLSRFDWLFHLEDDAKGTITVGDRELPCELPKGKGGVLDLIYSRSQKPFSHRQPKVAISLDDAIRDEISRIIEGATIERTLVVLWKRGILEKFNQKGSVRIQELDGSKNFFEYAFRYLELVGYVTIEGDDLVRPTPLGTAIFKNPDIFGVPDAHSHNLWTLSRFSAGGDYATGLDDRPMNVKGSGGVHERRYFPAVLPFLEATSATTLFDVGCGSGRFPIFARERVPRLRLAGADFNPAALEVARANLNGPGGPGAALFEGDVMEPAALAASLRAAGIDPRTAFVSIWFIIQEGLRVLKSMDEAKIVLPALLRSYHEQFGGHGMAIGEMFRIPGNVVAHSRGKSTAAVYRYFHDLSGQVLLPLEWWHGAIDASGVWDLEEFIPRDMVGPDDAQVPWLGIFVLKSRARAA